jgi:hypothetical protein
MAFHSRWLDHEGFLASMPMRCAFSGATDRRDLLARPLAFCDRSGGTVRSPQDIEAQHERHLETGETPRDLVETMGRIDHMPRPFNRVMPYYVSLHFTHQSLKGATSSGEEGIVCEVLLPEPGLALAWLGRVNGVCGGDYALLEEEVSLLQSDAWGELSHACRQRLGAWCNFHPGERFRLYVNDADFGMHDAGLAGLVITDQRVIFHKYHRRGEVGLDAEAIVQARADEDFAQLTLLASSGRTRMVRLHFDDVDRVADMLREAPGLRMKFVEA